MGQPPRPLELIQPFDQAAGGYGADLRVFIQQVEDRLTVRVAIPAMSHDVQDGVMLVGDPVAQFIERGFAVGPFYIGQDFEWDLAQSVSHTGHSSLPVKMWEPGPVVLCWVGHQHQRPQITAPDGRKATVGQTGQVEGEQQALVQSQVSPPPAHANGST